MAPLMSFRILSARPRRSRSSCSISFTNPRFVEVLACAPSLMPVHSVVAREQLTPYVAVDARACYELSQTLRVSSVALVLITNTFFFCSIFLCKLRPVFFMDS
ncbi:hypothetical protein RND81_09G072900 [Saponaria officinalis]|uniref:Uncharacterized protein n=1 Tax=Saponaria officinalis TaxID=3572 RepID=A0AAW1IJU2_SAPOF